MVAHTLQVNEQNRPLTLAAPRDAQQVHSWGPRSPVLDRAPFLFTSDSLVMKKHVPISCYGLGCVPPNSHLDTLAPGTSECDLVWIEGRERGDCGKMRSLG